MLTFFRRIRKGLIGDGATRKYLLYAAGEVFLVMVGILLALQVNNWNEWRKDRQSEQDSILRMHQESELSVAYFKSNIRWFERIIEESDRAAKALHNRSMSNIDTFTFIEGINNVGLYPSITPPRSVYDELNASGKLRLIQSDTLRGKIVEYYTQLQSINSMLDYFRLGVNNPNELAHNEFYAVYDSTKIGRRRYHFNFENLMYNKSFISSHTSGLRDLIQFQNFRKRAYNLVVDMCIKLGEASNQTCSSAK